MGQSGTSAHARHHGGRGQGLSQAPATVIIVAYRTTELDLTWIPGDAVVVVVRNDDQLDPDSIRRAGTTIVDMPDNVGFGRAVNAALPYVETPRIVLCNPDVSAHPGHWRALTTADRDEVVAVPQVDSTGRSTSVVNEYPTPMSLLVTGYRIGRLLGRHNWLRRALEPLLGSWGRAHRASFASAPHDQVWPLRTCWASASLLSIPTDAFRAVGGFDPRYFLYLEDTDLCRRLADRDADLTVRIATTVPAEHLVGGSAPTGAERRTVDRHYVHSIRRYTGAQRGLGWRLCELALAPRRLWLR